MLSASLFTFFELFDSLVFELFLLLWLISLFWIKLLPINSHQISFGKCQHSIALSTESSIIQSLSLKFIFISGKLVFLHFGLFHDVRIQQLQTGIVLNTFLSGSGLLSTVPFNYFFSSSHQVSVWDLGIGFLHSQSILVVSSVMFLYHLPHVFDCIKEHFFLFGFLLVEGLFGLLRIVRRFWTAGEQQFTHYKIINYYKLNVNDYEMSQGVIIVDLIHQLVKISKYQSQIAFVMSSQQQKVDITAQKKQEAAQIQKQQINQDQKQNDKQESEHQVDQSDICSAPKQTQQNEISEQKQQPQNQKIKSSSLSAQLEEIEKKQSIEQQETYVQQVRQPPTPQQLFRHEQEMKQKQRIINQILKMYDDFERLQLRSEQLQSENNYFIEKIQEYEKIVYEDSDVSNA